MYEIFYKFDLKKGHPVKTLNIDQTTLSSYMDIEVWTDMFNEIGGMKDLHNSKDHVLRTDNFELPQVKMIKAGIAQDLRLRIESKKGIHRILIREPRMFARYMRLHMRPYMQYKCIDAYGRPYGEEVLESDLFNDFSNFDF